MLADWYIWWCRWQVPLSVGPIPGTLAVNTGLVCWAQRSTEPSWWKKLTEKRGRIGNIMKWSYFDACSVCNGKGSGGGMGNPGSFLACGSWAWPLHRVLPLLKSISSSAKWGQWLLPNLQGCYEVTIRSFLLNGFYIIKHSVYMAVITIMQVSSG